MKKVNKVLDKTLDEVQRRYGKITKEKVIALVISGLLYISVAGGIVWIFVSVSDLWRILLTVAFGLLVTIYIVMRFRNSGRKMMPHFKIPVQPKAREEYVSVERPNTAEIPVISFEQPHQNTPQNSYSLLGDTSPPKMLNLEEVELSKFARNRIAEENYLPVTTAVFEIRKSSKELFFQLIKRRPTITIVGEEKDPTAGQVKKKTVTTRPPRSTIYGEIAYILVSIGVLLLPVIMGMTPTPEWASQTYSQFQSSQLAQLMLLGVGCALMAWSLFLFYRKWANWYYWRVVLILPDQKNRHNGGLVVIDKPPLLGGTVPLFSLRKINKCLISTGPTKEDEKGLRSMLMQWLGIRFMKVDVPGGEIEDINLMGPIGARDAAYANRVINDLSAKLHTGDRE